MNQCALLHRIEKVAMEGYEKDRERMFQPADHIEYNADGEYSLNQNTNYDTKPLSFSSALTKLKQ